MNKKGFKRWAMFLAAGATMLSACSFLAACGEEYCDGQNSDNGDGFVGIKSEKVANDDEWRAAFDFSKKPNLTEKTKMSSSAHVFDFHGKLTDDKIECYQIVLNNETAEESLLHYIMVYDFDKPYIYKNNHIFEGTVSTYRYDTEADKWEYSESGFDKDNSPYSFYVYNALVPINENLTPVVIADSFSKFTYDEEKFEYVASWDKYEWEMGRSLSNLNISLKIKDGKLAEFNMTYSSPTNNGSENKEEDYYIVTSEIYDIGKTVVEIPQVE